MTFCEVLTRVRVLLNTPATQQGTAQTAASTDSGLIYSSQF